MIQPEVTRMTRGRPKSNPEALFWSHVDKSGDCWLWTGFCLQNGYGRFQYNGTNVYAHRYAWAVANGCDIPDSSVQILHNTPDCPRRCVNPAHLQAGDAVVRAQLMIQHGRDRKGKYKLTYDEMADARRLFIFDKWDREQLAKRYDCSVSTITLALRGYPDDPQCQVVEGDLSRAGRVSLDDAEVIRDRFAMGVYSMQQLADIYDIDISYVSLIIAGKRKNNPPRLVDCE